MKITPRLTLLFLCLSLAPVSLLTALYYRQGELSLRRELDVTLSSRADRLKERLEGELRQHREKLHLMLAREILFTALYQARSTGPREWARQSERIREVFLNTCRRVPEFRNLVILDGQGHVVLEVEPVDDVLGAALGSAFQRGRREEGQVGWARRGDSLSLFLSGPVEVGNRKLGVLVLEISGGGLERILAKPLDDRWRAAASLYEGGETVIPARMPLEPSAERLTTSRSLPAPGWTLTLDIDRASAFAPIRRLHSGTLAAFAAACLASLAASLLVSRRITRPFLRLAALAREFGAGNLSRRSGLASRDELGELGRSLDAMAADLERSRRELEETVANRTEALRREVEERKRAAEGLREAREELREYVDHLSTLSAKVSLKGRVLMANRMALLATGLSSESLRRTDFLSGPWFRHDPEVARRVRGAFLQAADGIPVSIEEKVLLYGRLTDLEIAFNPMVDRSGNIAYILAEGRDISALKEAQATLHEVNESLEESVRDRTESLRAALREKDMLLREIHHRVKNNLQIISSLLSLQSVHVRDREVAAVLTESRNRVKSMALVHERLYAGDDLGRVGFSGYLRDLAAQLVRSSGADERGVVLDLELEDLNVGLTQAIPCGLTIHELVANSLKHAFPPGHPVSGGHPKVSLRCCPLPQGGFELEVEDNGVGLPEGYEANKGRTLGLQLVFTLVRQLKGRLVVERGRGSRFRISIPAEKKKEEVYA